MDEIVIKIEPLDDSDAEEEESAIAGDSGADREAGMGIHMNETSNFVQPEVQLMPPDAVRNNLNKALDVINQAMEVPLDAQPGGPATEVPPFDLQPVDPVAPSLMVIKHIEGGVASSSVCDSIFRNLNKASIEIGKTFVEASRPGYSDRPFATGPYRGPYRCEQCGKVFTVWRALLSHTKTHRAPHKCRVCGRVFLSEHGLNDHLRLHPEKRHLSADDETVDSEPIGNDAGADDFSGGETHKCSICGQVFELRRQLRRHAVQHVGEKPFQCQLCDLAFERPRQLRSHGKVHSGRKKHQCSHCGHKFKSPGELTEHSRIHSGERPYQCSHCPGKFARLASLKRHKKAHAADKAHRCRSCDKSYTEAYLLKDHERLHTGEMPYQCEHCGGSFRLLCQLKRHVVLEHSQDLQASLIGTRTDRWEATHIGGEVEGEGEAEEITVAGTVDQDVPSTGMQVETE